MSIWNFLLFSFIFQSCILSSVESQISEINLNSSRSFLQTLASMNVEEWKKTNPEKSYAKLLSDLKDPILQSDDLSLIKLYQRAVRNHDSLSDEKADPVPTYYKHYQPPEFFIPKIDLTLDVQSSFVQVTSRLVVKRNSDDTQLIVDGRGHVVREVLINGQTIPTTKYQVTLHELILNDIPKENEFIVEIHSEINPFENYALEGMYACGKWLTTQCESEGARRIFFTLDRPDVLSEVTTTIIADQNKYPYRLSNGNFVQESITADGRLSITWHDPFPKPSYLFACVLGDFAVLKDDYTTRSGLKVNLEVFVEKGKEKRGEYSLYALKKAMEFDEEFFDREYDLSSLKMVAIPDFNAGAMENKGLMIFNDIRLLIDPQTGSDRVYRDIAHVIAHEYFHNWSGNRVTVRNWFEIALKEAFTDLRAMLFSEWLFGEEFIRPKAVQLLKEFQFPEEKSERAHPIIVESYIDAHSIYDFTTYIKGREIFHALKKYIDVHATNGFKDAQNLFFSRYDGQAVTFRELLKAGNEVLQKVGKNLNAFERWFYQQGTPHIDVKLEYDSQQQQAKITITQSCPHPKTKQEQEPFQIPFSVELLNEQGFLIHPKVSCILEEAITTLDLPVSEKPIPVFFHGYPAPVTLHYNYQLSDLSCIIQHTNDAYCRWQAAQQYSLAVIRKMVERSKEDESNDFASVYEMYAQVLCNQNLSPLAKAQILEAPTLRDMARELNNYDYEQLEGFQKSFNKQLAHSCQKCLEEILHNFPSPKIYEPHSDQMQIRELRAIVLKLLLILDKKYEQMVIDQYKNSVCFDDAISAFHLCMTLDSSTRQTVITDFYQKWKSDKVVFNYWLSEQSLSPFCTVQDLIQLEWVDGYSKINPNHIRSVVRSFIQNLARYHSKSGDGYDYVCNKIASIALFNPFLAHQIAEIAFLEFDKIPFHQKKMMIKSLFRLKENEHLPAQTRDLVNRLLESSEKI